MLKPLQSLSENIYHNSRVRADTGWICINKLISLSKTSLKNKYAGHNPAVWSIKTLFSNIYTYDMMLNYTKCHFLIIFSNKSNIFTIISATIINKCHVELYDNMYNKLYRIINHVVQTCYMLYFNHVFVL